MFAKLRLSILSAQLLARRCPPRHRSLPIRNRPRPAASAFALTRPRPVLLPLHPSQPQRKYSPPPLLLLASRLFRMAADYSQDVRQIMQALCSRPALSGRTLNPSTATKRHGYGDLARFRRLLVVRLLQSSSEIFCGVLAKFLFEHGWIGKFSGIGARQRGLKRLMNGERF